MRARVAALEDRQLLTKGKVFKDKIATGAESGAKGAEEAQEDGSHHVTMPQVRRDRGQFSPMGAGRLRHRRPWRRRGSGFG